MLTKEQGDAAAVKEASDDIIYRIEIGANRSDLLCLEGLTLALKVFMGNSDIPKFVKVPGPGGKLERMTVTKSTQQIRPFVVGAILRNITFTKESYDSFIDLQDKLHQNICRRRTLCAIGTHDYDTIRGPFVYDAKPPKQIKFKPLNQDKEYTGEQLMELYSTHAQLKAYLPIIRDSPVYPVIYDANGVVLSMPPIINGDHSKISVNTKNVFIECTATDLTKAKIVLDTIVCLFSTHCKVPGQVEMVEIVQADGKSVNFPELAYRTERITAQQANKYIGINEPAENIVKYLNRLSLRSSLDGKDGTIAIEVGPTRHDILQACDIYEDIAIAYGYNKIPKIPPGIMQVAAQFPLNKVTHLLREQVAQAGFTEALTFTLCSRDDVSVKLNKKLESVPAVHIANPKTLEFQVVRTSLLPGLLKTVAANKKMPLPLKIFEISDVVLIDETKETGAHNQRNLCAVYNNKHAGFEVVHGLLDRVMQLLQVTWTKDGSGYYLEANDDTAYFPGRCANVVFKGQIIGRIGALHPTVLHAFEISNPCTAVEINIEPLL